MNFIPNPLHPALVHFPIALILLGTVVAIATVFIRHWHLPWLTAGLLGLGAMGAVAATWSGEEAADAVMGLSPQGKQVLEEHEEWGERARNMALIAAAAAVTSVALGKFPMGSRSAAGLAALAAIGASFCVAEAGHYGGKLVYQHGAGMQLDAGKPGDAPLPDHKSND
ncbi:MAG: DUF2231 domain-containing protein [Luteolibacter sp.]